MKLYLISLFIAISIFSCTRARPERPIVTTELAIYEAACCNLIDKDANHNCMVVVSLGRLVDDDSNYLTYSSPQLKKQLFDIWNHCKKISPNYINECYQPAMLRAFPTNNDFNYRSCALAHNFTQRIKYLRNIK